MKKIDLHIHTLSTISDNPFTFSLEVLSNYVRSMAIDCIAITNHNTFDATQFTEITSTLKIDVLPGVEIDLEGGHILVIGDKSDFGDFASKCAIIQTHIVKCGDDIAVEQFKSIFTDLSKYLLIPHYDKRPNLKQEVIKKLDGYIWAGEVASVRKFKSCLKEKDSLVPVIFSDLRPHDELEIFPVRQTYVDLNAITLAGIKSCLSDKAKVFLDRDGGNELFQVTPAGLKLSTGLNVIFGERSSGKTFTLEEIQKLTPNVKYIKQFSLLQDDVQQFDKLLSAKNSPVAETFLNEFKAVVSGISSIDLRQNELDVKQYIETLLKYASESDKADSFSNATLYSETAFSVSNQEGLTELINAVSLLIDNNQYRDIIDKHVTQQALKNLAIELMIKYIQEYELNLKKSWVNILVDKIKKELKFKSAITAPEEIDLYKIALDIKRVDKFSQVVNQLRTVRQIDKKEIGAFKVIASSVLYKNATSMKTRSKRNISFVEAFSHYNVPYDFLQYLKGMEELDASDHYKLFVDVEYKTLNKHGFAVSGGERSEFNLLNEIQDALKYDLLLLDEPESSFDNLFLKSEVNGMIKHIAQSIPVVLVTHNNTVGASISPDYVLYTEKLLNGDTVEYTVYTGHPSDKILKSTTGKSVSNFEVMLNCLEAGSDTYDHRRKQHYEILKN